jgi:SAM-dependent methyltransferase
MPWHCFALPLDLPPELRMPSCPLDLLLSVGRQLPCKVCAGTAELYGVVDFSKSCEEQHGVFVAMTGVPVYYHRCPTCGLIFTSVFDHWPLSKFAEHIYNEDYATVDPDYLERRPTSNADLVAQFIRRGSFLRVLDYGGGNGLLAGLLRARGIAASSWDAMIDRVRPEPAAYDVVTSFEVFEHTPDPVATCAEALACLRPQGVLLFTTLTVDKLPPRAAQFWYIAPRNGHVTIHTRQSLARLFARFGYQLHHFSDVLHVAMREVPAWLA